MADHNIQITHRYRGLLISFLIYACLLAAGLFYLNTLTSKSAELQTRNDAIGKLSDSFLNLRTNINIIAVEYLRGNFADIEEHINESIDDINEGNRLFEILEKGGDYSFNDKGENVVYLPPFSMPKHAKRFADFRQKFNHLNTLLISAFGGQESFKTRNVKLNKDELEKASEYVSDDMENVYDDYIGTTWNEHLEKLSTLGKTSRNILIGLAALTALYFLMFAFYFIRQLGKADKQTIQARKEITDIMATVNEGLFLIDRDLVISSQYSAQLESVIGEKNIANQKFDRILEKIISLEDLETTRLFINQLMNKKVVSELIASLNPLLRVKLKTEYNQPERWLSFNFLRVEDEEEISHVLVSVADITKEIELEEKLKEANKKHNEQLELISAMLSTEPHLFLNFVEKSRNTAVIINNSLQKQTNDSKLLSKKLDIIFREVHSLKGEASAINFSIYTSLFERFESKIQALKRQADLKGNDFLSIAVFLEELELLNDKVDILASRINNTERAKQLGQHDINELLTRLTHQVAERNGKRVKLLTENLDSLPENVQSALQDALVQMVRNAIVHGIETPEERKQKGKLEEGRISIRYNNQNNLATLIVEDDGKGIDFEKLAEIAKSQGVKPDQGGSYSKRKLISVMFGSGISTAKQTSEDAGRGVGTAVIYDRFRKLNGKMNIDSEFNKFTRFSFQFVI